jgi:transposase
MSGVARSTVRDMIARFERSGLSWPVPAEISDADLETAPVRPAGVKPGRRKQPEPDWSVVARELKRKHVTLQVCGKNTSPSTRTAIATAASATCSGGWEGRLPLTCGRATAAARSCSSTTPATRCRWSTAGPARVRDAHLFVAVLGGSSLSFACATWTEQLGDWIEAHNAAFAFFGGAPQLLVPDNAKVAVIKACHFDPMVNRSYTDMARHYGTAVLPARPRRPRDKAKVEACVGIVERWLLGRLRNRIFYSLAELNAGIAECMADLNEARVLRQFGKTRRQLFEEVDAPNLKPLPAEPWVHAEWKRCRVGLDYHIASSATITRCPCRFARREVEARITARTVEVFLGGERIAVHMRGSGNGRHTTIPEHMPSSHRRYRRLDAGEDPRGGAADRADAVAAGREDHREPAASRAGLPLVPGHHRPRQALRARAARGRRAARAGDPGAQLPSVKSILEKGLDRMPAPKSPEREPILHTNIRGSRYYH